MIIWLNGPFGSGKTTLSELLLKRLSNAIIFDPEMIGYVIHKTVPESRSKDFQDFPMWREHVIQFAKNLSQQFGKDLIIPMTLVKPEYLQEIHEGLRDPKEKFFHFFLTLDQTTLKKRIEEQVIDPNSPANDLEIRAWRLQQIDRCLAAIPNLPREIHLLDSGNGKPQELVDQVLKTIGQL